MKENYKLLPPCTYQGGKQRVSMEIVDYIIDHELIYPNTKIYDICCGSGVITIEWINRGVNPNNIIMLDKSSWGKFWQSIGNGTFSISKWDWWCNQVPKNKFLVQGFLEELCKDDANIDEEYKYIILQSGSFGGKQIWKEDNIWKNTSFRSYWQPTKTSKRRSPVNPMQPSIENLQERVKVIAEKCIGLTCIHNDINSILPIVEQDKSDDSVIYIDPPYSNTTGYGFKFNLGDFLSELFDATLRPIYVSEKEKIAEEAILLNFNGAKGGISGKKNGKNEEWLNVFR